MINYWHIWSKRILFSLSLVVVLGLAGSIPTAARYEPIPPRPGWLAIDPAQLHTGDLIFRRTRGMVSQLYLSTDEEAQFTHVGMVYIIGDQTFIIHTVPGQISDGTNRTRIEPLEAFLDHSITDVAAVYRLRPEFQDYVFPASDIALSYVQDRLPFDMDFNLETTDTLYCTELVWRAYLTAGLDLVDGNFDQISLPLTHDAYLFTSTLMESPKLHLVAWLNTIQVREK